MPQSIRRSDLIAEAGPRVRAPRNAALPQAPARAANTLVPRGASVDAHASSVCELFRNTTTLVSTHPLDGRDPVRHLTWLIPVATLGPVVALVVGAPWWLAAAAVASGTGLGLRWTRGLSRRVACLAREITAELEHGVAPHDMAEEIETLVAMDPENDAARLVLAQVRIEQEDFVGTLLQLAPLRDRHPDDGAVVLLAAVAYARMGSTLDALRMLEALRPDPAHPWMARVREFQTACAQDAASAVRASGDESDFDPVES